MTDFSRVVGLVTGISQATKRLLDARQEPKINEVAIHLQGIVLDLQSEMLMIQSDYQQVLRAREDLEKKLAAYENWEAQRARYHLERVGQGIFVYALNTDHQGSEPVHWLCTRCYDNKQKSILQRVETNDYCCPVCKMQISPTKCLP
jgi:rubrerythrin